MSLFPYGIGFGQPSFNFTVNVRHGKKAEMMDVISGRDCINSTESRVLQPAREHYMTVNPAQTRSQLREGHPHLKGDAGFFRQDGHQSAPPDCLEHGVKDRADFRRLAVKMRLQIVPAAEV
jgi:hypothetical protein